jgi:magnesium chelatase family protein
VATPSFVRRRLSKARDAKSHGRWQPFEDGKVTVSGAAGSVTFVSNRRNSHRGHGFIAARECRCGPLQVQRYRQRISGPLLDRIDLHIEVPAVEYRDISSTRMEEGSAAIRERVGHARAAAGAVLFG